MPPDIGRIVAIAEAAPIVRYRWIDRGPGPKAYYGGMAVAFAIACDRLAAANRVAMAIAAPCSGNPDRDVLDWYKEELGEAGLDLGLERDRLIGVFTVLLGLGMRESSGKYCEGRDESGGNERAETAEAGLFQVSYNSIGFHPLLRELFQEFSGRDDLRALFERHVSCSEESWKNWGEGRGAEFQGQTKTCPLFAVLYAALLVRSNYTYSGPINRNEVEVIPAAASLFLNVMEASSE